MVLRGNWTNLQKRSPIMFLKMTKARTICDEAEETIFWTAYLSALATAIISHHHKVCSSGLQMISCKGSCWYLGLLTSRPSLHVAFTLRKREEEPYLPTKESSKSNTAVHYRIQQVRESTCLVIAERVQHGLMKAWAPEASGSIMSDKSEQGRRPNINWKGWPGSLDSGLCLVQDG